MPNNAIPRANWHEGLPLEDWMEAEIKRNPSYQIPRGYTRRGDQVTRNQPHWVFRNPWIFPAAGIATGAGLMAAGVGGAGAAGSVAAAGAGGNFLTNALKKLGLKDYLAIAAALGGQFGPGGVFNRGDTAGQKGLEDILGISKRRIEDAEPLYQGLLSHAGTSLSDAAPVTRGLASAANENLQSGQDLYRNLTARVQADPTGQGGNELFRSLSARAQADPTGQGGQELFRALTAMAQGQMPTYSRGGR